MKKAEHFTKETNLIQLGVGFDDKTGAISVPIYPSATYRHPGVGESTGYDYTRSGNPTRQVLENGLAELEGGSRGLVFSSGMAALTTFFLHFSQGDHLIVSEDLYGGTYRVLDQIFANFGLTVSYVNTTDTEAVAAAISDQTRALLVETPGNPLLGISDLATLGKVCQKLLANQTKDSIEANINTLTDWAETQLKVLDFQGKLRIQQKLIEDKETHFKNVFMPQFEKESKEAKENSKALFDKVQNCYDEEREDMKDILHKMSYELGWWNKCSEEQQKNEEFLIQIYKPLKRLVSAYEDRVKEIAENSKYTN